MNDSNERFIARWIVLALVYFIGAIGLGVFMAASHDFRLKGLHVHMNLLGWVSMALMGVIYRLYPQAARTRLAHWHFWLYQAALPLMMAGLGALLLGVAAAEPVVAVGSLSVLVAVLLFVVAIWRRDAPSTVHLGQPKPSL